MRGLADRPRAVLLQRFFKTAPGEYGAGDRFVGIRVPALRQIARSCDDLPLGDVSQLVKSPWHEERLLALLILVRRHARAEPAQRDVIVRLYLRNRRRINNWDLVDCSATHIVGACPYKTRRALLARLARSTRAWDRRIAIVSTFHDIHRGEYAGALSLARLLLDDPHDLIHKAVGWMLREAGKRDRAVEEAFLRRHASRMPRTMLRYAIERFPPRLRRAYLDALRDVRGRRRRSERVSGRVERGADSP